MMPQQRMQGKPSRQQIIENQIRFTFLVLQHRIEERNWPESVQQSMNLSKLLMELQKISVDAMQPEQNNDTSNPDQTG